MSLVTPIIEVAPGLLAPAELADEIDEYMDDAGIELFAGYSAMHDADTIVLDGEYSTAELRLLARIAELLPSS